VSALGGRLPWLLLAAGVLALDLVTKAIVLSNMEPYRSIPVIPGLFDLTFVQNPGGVFGVFKGMDSTWRSVLFTVVPVAAILLITAYARHVPPDHRITQSSLAMILGGAVGNLIDRVRLGYVVDFVDVHWRGWHWPAFNVADAAICVGVGLLMLETLRSPSPAPARDAGGPGPSPGAPPIEPARRDMP
jgi:signal peptidase II